MKESVWGYFVIVIGIVIIFLVFFFQNITNIDEHNMTLLKSVTESSMNDAIDWVTYKESGVLRISEEVFIENFIRRFAEDAQLSSTYKIKFYKVQEEPPLVNIRIYTSTSTNATGENMDFELTNTLNAVLETDPNREGYSFDTTITSTAADSKDEYQCEIKFDDDGDLIVYDITNRSDKAKVKKAYIDGIQAGTNLNNKRKKTISIGSSQVTGFALPLKGIKEYTGEGIDKIEDYAYHTGNLIYEDGNVALCLYNNK